MVLSADPSLLGLAFGVTGTVDAATSTVLFLRCASGIRLMRAVVIRKPEVVSSTGSLRSPEAMAMVPHRRRWLRPPTAIYPVAVCHP